jgi:VWFA-related protein
MDANSADLRRPDEEDCFSVRMPACCNEPVMFGSIECKILIQEARRMQRNFVQLNDNRRSYLLKEKTLMLRKPCRAGALISCFACLICCLVSFGASQGETASPAVQERRKPVFSIEASMVVVDLSVRDRKGNLIDGLKKDDFKIYEDGVLQEIVTFSAEKVAIGPPKEAPAAGASAESPAPVPVINLSKAPENAVKKLDMSGKRLIVLFFDLSSLDAEFLIRSVDAARYFLEKQSGPQDLVAIATYSSTLSLVQDFTNDRNQLLKVLNAISSEESEGSQDSSTSTDTSSDSSTSEDTFIPDTVQFDIFNTDRRLAALETLAKMYRDFPERKSLVYFSSGVSTTGIENNAQIRSAVDAANRSNMSIYTVDSRGLVALPPGGDASKASPGSGMLGGGSMASQRSALSGSQETLITLSHDTGGRAFTDLNDLTLAMKQVQADTNVYYVLGYYSTNPKEDGKYRKIKVESNRQGMKLEHRPGYFASKKFKQLNQQEKDVQLQQALNVDRPFVDVPLILEADYFRKDDTTVHVPISMLLDGDGLHFEEKGSNRESNFEFIAQATDAKGKVTGVTRDSVQVKLPAEKAEKIKEGGIFYSTGFQLRPGSYKLKFLVRDNSTGKFGSFEQPIDVPSFDLKKFSLSSIILGNQLVNASGDSDRAVSHQGTMRRFQMRIPTYDPLVMGNRKVVPSIGSVFLARQTVHVYFQVYGAAEDKESHLPCIETDLVLIRNNTKILETQPQYVQEWTQPGGFRFGSMAPPNAGRGMARPEGGPMMGGPGGMGPGGMGPGMGGPPGMQAFEERKGESTVAISLPLKSLQKGTYILQIHVRDVIADVNRFERVPLVIE